MNPPGGPYNNAWQSQPLPPPGPGRRRFLPVSGTFTDPTVNGPPISHHPGQSLPAFAPNIPSIPSQHLFQQPQQPLLYRSPYPHHQPPTSPVPIPPTSAPYEENLNDDFLLRDPVVHEGFIPAPGREHDEDLIFQEPLFNTNFDSSSEYDSEEERMLQGVEEKNDNVEVDEDYSVSEGELEPDPDEILPEDGFDDEDEPPVPKRGRPKGKLTRVRGRKKGARGPQAVADPGPQYNRLQKLANDAYTSQDFETAIAYASQAIQVNPEIFMAYNILSEAYAGLGNEPASIENLIMGAYTKREPELWWSIIYRIENIDVKKYPQYTDAFKKEWCVNCLRSIIRLDPNTYNARIRKLEIEAERGKISRCVKLCQKLLRMEGHEHEYDLLKQMAMLGTSSPKQTRIHLDSIIEYFDTSIAYFVAHNDETLDWNLLNIYLDLLDRAGDYDHALTRLKQLCRWKQGRESETYWDDEQDDREFDIEDVPRRVAVPQFKRTSDNVDYGANLPMEIRVKLGLFRLQQTPSNYEEGMYHLNMLEPENEGPYAYVHDYADVFREIADILHMTGQDRAALRFYEPLLRNNKAELNMKSYIGLYTCYKNLKDVDNGDAIIDILKEWNASTLDDLAILAKFFEDVGMQEEARQRAETLYRNKGGWLLRKVGYQAYYDLLEHFKQMRKKARGKGDVKKVKARKNRRKVTVATGIEHDSDEEDATNERPSSKSLNRRPEKGRGLYRKTIRPLAPQPPIFLPVQGDSSGPSAESTTSERPGVLIDSIGRKIFLDKIQNLATNNADEFQSKRAQHREIIASFKRLHDLHEPADSGDEDASSEYLSVARELVEEFSTFDLFYSERRHDFKGYFRRTGDGELWKESALLALAVEANRVEDGEEERVLEERPSDIEQTFWGIDFSTWVEMFGRYALYLARKYEPERCFSALDIAMQSNVVFRSSTFMYQLELVRLACALAVSDSIQISSAVRAFLRRFPVGADMIRLYSVANRLCPVSDAYAHGAAHKAFLRYIKTVDYVMLKPEQRIKFNFQGDDKTPLMTGVINQDMLSKVKGHDPSLFALYGHVLMCSGSYKGALNYYFRAFAMTPEDPVLNLCIGIAYLQHSMKRQAENRQFQIQQGMAFMSRYYDLRTKDNIALHCSEAEYNMGRMWHGLGLVTHALKAYTRCIALSDRVKQEAADQCRDDNWAAEDFAAEAAYAVQTIYTLSGDFEAARGVTEAALVIE
ncbi:TPR-like protein [Periconia macrospinosa]|uniref:TPR-like protein n=1 Tax=Periconia macrospinosa TaxID=97972 RepID=A0A2V1E8V5_9PLEO|nr:TPR-like protein [Periconia macrospinosa]